MHALKRFEGTITTKQYGRDCFIKGNPTEEDIQLARDGLQEMKEIVASGKYDVVILDEANVAHYFKLFSTEDLLSVIDVKPEHVELVFTGRKAPQELINRADLVTEMREVKHYYQKGVQARGGIET